MIEDPFFYMMAVPAVVMIGLSKGGFGGAGAILGVPLLMLAVDPVRAAAILLPILVVMDIAGLYAWRGTYDVKSLAILLPGAVLGIGIGWLLAGTIGENQIRLIVGTIGLVFSLNHYLRRQRSSEGRPANAAKGGFWGAVAGFTSFLAHAGGPPFQMYMLPLRLDPRLYAGTSVIFFAVVNAVKLPPYFFLGQFSAANLATSAVLLPIAPFATLFGAWLVKMVSPHFFYALSYAMVLLVSVKLIFDGVSALLS
ncbi:sulfite exporter TauE/SafE family protein [Afifella pfennigii]|uniref:sulfite exporter TauE/SafE family protein n=1 Tax=Afifella pfennigii TaxID=209897 RepID=UPI000479E56B|nr:sulfite exporter TauE/SafE family protein [Afifella pfennigii]